MESGMFGVETTGVTLRAGSWDSWRSRKGEEVEELRDQRMRRIHEVELEIRIIMGMVLGEVTGIQMPISSRNEVE